MIGFYSQDIPFVLKHKRLFRTWIEEVLESESFEPGDINFIFCSDEYLLKMNKDFLGHDYFTDVITFPYEQEGTDVISGDIFISIDTVRANARTYKVHSINELARVMVHGILHLCDYDDLTEEEQIRIHAREDLYLYRLPTACRS